MLMHSRRRTLISVLGLLFFSLLSFLPYLISALFITLLFFAFRLILTLIKSGLMLSWPNIHVIESGVIDEMDWHRKFCTKFVGEFTCKLAYKSVKESETDVLEERSTMMCGRDTHSHDTCVRGARGRGARGTHLTRAHPSPVVEDLIPEVPIQPVPPVDPVPPSIPPPQSAVPITEAPVAPTRQPATTEVSGQSNLPRVSAIAREFRRHDPPRFSGDLDPFTAEAWRTEVARIFYTIQCLAG
ncbi:uncharacterized protein LOC131250689 [Magnolia sinica]|uniref:uncharacterized protein LOC131250689 n=1 Tax=Magnolia sinica TaxID=86752 RepID=UPI002658B467|nr:uncharacterized protein LOC131250689 [Magnolia sinica]